MAYYEGVQKKAKPVERVGWGYDCRAPGCRGFACFSDDMGKTWFCRADAPAGFFPHQRAAPSASAALDQTDPSTWPDEVI